MERLLADKQKDSERPLTLWGPRPPSHFVCSLQLQRLLGLCCAGAQSCGSLTAGCGFSNGPRSPRHAVRASQCSCRDSETPAAPSAAPRSSVRKSQKLTAAPCCSGLQPGLRLGVPITQSTCDTQGQRETEQGDCSVSNQALVCLRFSNTLAQVNRGYYSLYLELKPITAAVSAQHIYF